MDGADATGLTLGDAVAWDGLLTRGVWRGLGPVLGVLCTCVVQGCSKVCAVGVDLGLRGTEYLLGTKHLWRLESGGWKLGQAKPLVPC